MNILKKILLIISIVLIFQSCISTKFNSADKKACRIVEANLEIISDFIFYSIGTVDMVIDSSNFMEKISGHESKADIQFDGRQPPTINDYDTWTSWYTVNHDNLRYNQNKKEIYLLRED